MFGNNQIETLAKRVLRGEAEQSGRSSVPANDNAQTVCIDDRVSDLIDNPFCQLGLTFHGHAFRRILQSYARCYHEVRTHRSLDKDAPVSRPFRRAGSSISFPSQADSITATPGPEFSIRI